MPRLGRAPGSCLETCSVDRADGTRGCRVSVVCCDEKIRGERFRTCSLRKHNHRISSSNGADTERIAELPSQLDRRRRAPPPPPGCPAREATRDGLRGVTPGPARSPCRRTRYAIPSYIFRKIRMHIIRGPNPRHRCIVGCCLNQILLVRRRGAILHSLVVCWLWTEPVRGDIKALKRTL